MIVFLNGRFVPEDQAVVSVFDRGFLYGDGLFETIRVFNGQPFRWVQHFARLRRGATFLGIHIPFKGRELAAFARQLIERNRMPDAVLRLTLSRGVGRRGYSPKDASQPTLVMSLHPAPDATTAQPPRWKLITASVYVAEGDPLARFKTCNKLPQIVARAEVEAAGADEALLTNSSHLVTEASSANVFWIEDDTICTPPLFVGMLPGVTRATVFELCGQLGLPVAETTAMPLDLQAAAGVFLSLSSWGIVEVASLDGCRLRRSPLIGRLRAAYAELLLRECPPQPRTRPVRRK
jgi:branched-chain amino acid aminotransferase